MGPMPYLQGFICRYTVAETRVKQLEEENRKLREQVKSSQESPMAWHDSHYGEKGPY